MLRLLINFLQFKSCGCNMTCMVVFGRVTEEGGGSGRKVGSEEKEDENGVGDVLVLLYLRITAGS